MATTIAVIRRTGNAAAFKPSSREQGMPMDSSERAR
jgi:hypothetical protein